MVGTTIIPCQPLPDQALNGEPTGSVVDVLDRLGFTPDDVVGIGWQEDGQPFCSTLTTVADAPRVVTAHAHTSTWVNANPLREGIPSGRGKALDARGLLALTLDLDVGPGKLRSFQAARALVRDLADMLGVEPDVVVLTGHGLQVSWRVVGPGTRWSHEHAPEARAADRLRRRFQQYATDAAHHGYGATIDDVSDAARLRRVPGTWNRKDPAAPVPVRSEVRNPDDEPPLTITEVEHRLDLAGAPQVGERDLATAPAAGAEQVTAFCAEHPTGTNPGLARPILARFERAVTEGKSRHRSVCDPAAHLVREIDAGLLPASALDALGERFREAVTHDASTGDTRTSAEAAVEWLGIVSWAIGQKDQADPAVTRERALARIAPLPDEPPDDDPGLPREERLPDTTEEHEVVVDHEETAHVDEQHEAPRAAGGWTTALRDGGGFVLDLPDGIPAVWGRDEEVLWAEGEALIITGQPGVGKSTLAGQVVRARLGLGDGQVLGLPVAATGSRVLYLAMDRPQQIARSLARQFRQEDRQVLDERLRVWPGPPPADLARHPEALLTMVQAAEADTVIVDSLKDAAVGLTEDEVGAGYNRARQHVLAAGVQVLELHHTVKRNSSGGAPTSLADVYGSTWITSGAGSVVLLHGDPGDPVVSLRHLKQPGAEVGPWQVTHDHAAGLSTVAHGADLLAVVVGRGERGCTVKAAATAAYSTDTPSAAQVEKVRRRLGALVASGHLVVDETPGHPTVWRTAPLTLVSPSRMTSRS